MHGRCVAAAIFLIRIAAGSVTISTGVKLIKQMQLAEAQHCPLLIDWDSGGADINDGVASPGYFSPDLYPDQRNLRTHSDVVDHLRVECRWWSLCTGHDRYGDHD